VSLVSRLLLAQAAVTAAIGLAYLRRSMTWLLVILMVTVALCWLAGLVRSGGHAAWLAAVGAEAVLVAAGLAAIMSARYPGGTLLAMATLGVLLHPAVGRAFGPARRGGLATPREVRAGEQSLAGNAGGALGGGPG
jgi:hypothetical protein